MLEILSRLPYEFWFLLKEMAIYLLLGFAVAGALSAFVNPELVERHLGGRGQGPVWKATLFGIPLPLCSCGVIPVAASLRQHGASRSATTSFLLSTPQTGVDSILVTWGLLGPVLAVFRPLAALATGILGGSLVSALDRSAERPTAEPPASTCEDGCGEMPRGGSRLRRALEYGFIALPRDIAKALLVGMVIAAVITTLVPENFFADSLGAGPWGLLVMMLLGIPIYVCATGSVPLALGMIHMGISPGAALVFLITGPATNSATIVTVWKILGRRTAVIYLASVAVFALLSGLLLDALLARDWVQAQWAPSMGHHHNETLPGALKALGAWVLLGLMAVAFIGPAIRKRMNSREAPMKGDIQLQVDGMNCEHCSNSVRRALEESPGVRKATVDLATGRASVIGEGFDPARLKASVEALGYSVRVLTS